MRVLFQVLRGGFYFFTLVMGVFLLRGYMIFGNQVGKIVIVVLMPAYLLLCGVTVGYLISLLWSGRSPQENIEGVKEQILKKSFIIGILFGIFLALGYIIL